MPSRYTLNRGGGTHALLVRLVPRGSRVLDVGCSTGYLGELLAAKGCSVFGIEVDSHAVNLARSSGAYVEVLQLDLDEDSADLPPYTFDVILLADVVEHLRRPDNVIRRLCNLIQEPGQLIVSIPNVAHVSVRLQLLLGRFQYSESGILDRTHFHLYTYRTALELMRSAGLQVESVLAGSNRFGDLLSFGPRPLRWLRGLLAYNIVLVARPLGLAGNS